MASQYDSLFEGVDEPVLDSGSPTNQYQRPRNVPVTGASQYDSLFEGVDEPKKSGIFAWGKKGWADMLDYISITSQTPAALGAGDFDEELVAESVADINQRAREYVKSEGHKRILAMMQKEGKEFEEAEGFWETSKETLEWVGNAVLGMVTDPQGMAEFTAGQIGMQAPGIAGMFVGWISPIPGGAYAGMAAGELAVETGAGVFEAMRHRGIDTTDEKEVLDTLFNTDLLEELYKEGLVKGSTIAAFGVAGVGLQKFILKAGGRKLAKDLIKAGITKPLNKGGMAEAILAEAGGNTAVKAAFKTFADGATTTRRLGRAAGATTAELLTEMGGEAFGQKFAWGEIDPVEVGLEGLGALGQSVVQTAVVKGLSGTKELTNRALLKRAQRNALEKGEDSGITPEAINEDLQRRANAVRDRMVDIDTEMGEWEAVLSGADSNSSLTILADEVASLGGIEAYQSTLRTILQEELGTDSVPIWTALTKEEQATLAAGGMLDHAVRGSLNKGFVKPRGTEEVVAIKMPVASVIARGNWDTMEIVSSPFGIELVTPRTVDATGGDDVELEAEPAPLTEAQVAEREAVLTEEDIKLDREAEIGGLEEEAKTRSEKDVDVDINNVVVDTQNKLRQVKEASEYESDDLAGVVERLKLTPRGKTVSARREIITAYRKALENPSNVIDINKALINTGYKVTASKGVVKIVPIDSKNTRYKPLRVAETGSRKVGQDSIDDYIFWINEGQVTEAPKAKPVKRPSIRKSPLKGRTIITPQATGALTSLQTVFKRKGKGQFVERVRKLLSNKKGNDAILEQIAKVYRKSKPGRVEGDVASVLTLAGKSDQADIAKAYALLNMLITLQDSVSSILPDNTLSIEDKNVKLLARIELKTPIRGVRENQLINQIKDVFGEDSTYTRISDFEVAIGSPSLKPLQIARRLGRLKVKRNDIRNSGLFTAKTETHTHNWSEDPSGESIREQIRSLGFGDLLAWADDRRADYLNLAEEVGAEEVDQYRAEPRAPPEEATTELTDAVYKEFVRTGAVPSAILSSIANKIREGASLSDQERAIHTAKTAEVEDILAEEVVIISDVSEDIDEAVSYSLASEVEKMYQAGATIKGWKLFVQRKDGTLGPLFINRKLRVPIGDWMPAEAHPTKGFAFRPQWHATKVPVAPHLKEGQVGSQFRVWRQVELRGITPMERPESQGGTWFLANELRVPPVSEEDVAYSLVDDVGPTSGLNRKSRTTWIRTREKGLRVRRTIDVLGRVLTDHYRKIYGDPLTLTNKDDFNLAVNILSAEIKYQLQQEKTGEGWYGIDIEQAYDITEQIIPTIKNRDLNIIHAFVSSILSNDREVDVNWRNSTAVIKAYADTGIIPYRDPGTNMQFGYSVMAQQLRMLNNMLESWGEPTVAKWIMSRHTVSELNSVRREYGGMGPQGDLKGGADAVYLGAEVIGPKTGIFFLNIMGISDVETLTIDKWASRTINRIIGRMTQPDHGEWTTGVSKTGLIDVPRDSAERTLFQRVFAEAGKRNGLVKTRADGTIDYTDTQAVPWFFEQQLFTALGAPSTPLGFSDGARKALDQYKEGRIPRSYTTRAIRETNARAIREVSALSKATVPIEGAQESLAAPEDSAKVSLQLTEVEKKFFDGFGPGNFTELREDAPSVSISDGVLYVNRDEVDALAQHLSDFVIYDPPGTVPPRFRNASWVAKIDPVESLTPPEQPASGGLSALGLRRVLVKRFGKAGIAMLEAEGILVIVESATDLPVGLIKDEDAAMRARGLYHSKTGTAYLVANRLTASTAPKVLLHEVGTHFGLKRMLGSKAYATLILDLVAGKETTFAPWFERVRRNYRGRLNENTDRFAEEVIAHIAEDTSEVTLSIRDGIWRAVRLFLNRHLGWKLPKNLSAKEIGYVIQGSLRLAMRGRQRYMVVGTEEVMLGGRRIFFPDYAPTRALTDAHRRYAISSAIDRVIPPSEETRLRRNMDGMMKVAERVGKKGYPDIDIHLPVVVAGDAITSRYALFKNTKTGTELVIRMSDHPKTIYDAAGSYPFISFNNGHKIDSVDLSDIDRAVKLLSKGKLEGMNGLQFQFEYGLGDGVQGVSKPSMQKVSYDDYKRVLRKRSPSNLDRIQNLETVELTIGPIVDEEGPVFSIAPEGGRTPKQKQAVRRTLGAESNASVGEWVNDARHRWVEKFIQGAVDAYRPVRNLLGEGAERAWQMMHLSENANAMLMTALNFGRPKAVYKNGKFDWYSVDWEGEGLIDSLKGLNGETNDFMAWMTYVRAKKLMAEGREKNFTEEEIKTGLTLNQGEMADGRSRKLVYAQTMQKMSKYQSSMLDMAVEAGVISKAVREELEVDFYVPFYREFMPDEKTGMRGPTPVHDFVNIKGVIHKLRGSELSTHDVLHNVLMNWTALMSASMKNRAGQAAMDAAVKAGVARIITDKKEAAQLSFSKGKVRGEKLNRFVYVLKDGERVWYEVNDPLVLNSMVQMAWGGVDGKLIRTLSTFKRWLTLGVTASPYFKIRNMIRDTVHSIAVGKLKYNMFGNAAKGYDALKNDSLVSAEMMMGGATFHFGFYYDDPASLRMMLDAGISESRILNTPAKIRKGLRPFWKWYADMGNRMENANRASLYMQRKEEVGHLAASFEARDLMNFSSHGRWVAVQWLTSSLPFLNARIVGMEKLVRAGEAGTRARMLTVVSTVVLASILLRMSYEDDEDYEKLPEWQKNTYWAIKIPGTKDFFFLPKPFEIGAIASVGERITENFVRDIGWAGNPTRNYTFQQIGEIISDQLAVDWKPQIAKPVIELWRNKDTFTDRRIENISWQIQNTPRERRVRPYTTELAIRSSWAMGELLDMFNAKDTDIHLSPVQIDHLIKGYFGWLGAFTASSFDILSSDVEPTKHVTDMLGSFYRREPKGSDKNLALFYEQALEVAKYKSAYDAYKRDNMVEQALQVIEEHGDVLRWEKSYTKIRESIAKINRRIREIYDDPDMSPTAKDKELDKLRQLRVDIAKKTVLTRAQWEAAHGIEPSHASIPLEAMGGGD